MSPAKVVKPLRMTIETFCAVDATVCKAPRIPRLISTGQCMLRNLNPRPTKLEKSDIRMQLECLREVRHNRKKKNKTKPYRAQQN